jgi:hypothetical protein
MSTHHTFDDLKVLGHSFFLNHVITMTNAQQAPNGVNVYYSNGLFQAVNFDVFITSISITPGRYMRDAVSEFLTLWFYLALHAQDIPGHLGLQKLFEFRYPYRGPVTPVHFPQDPPIIVRAFPLPPVLLDEEGNPIPVPDPSYVDFGYEYECGPVQREDYNNPPNPEPDFTVQLSGYLTAPGAITLPPLQIRGEWGSWPPGDYMTLNPPPPFEYFQGF